MTRPMIFFLIVLAVFIFAQILLTLLPIDPRLGIIFAQFAVLLGGALIYRRKFAKPQPTWPSLRRLGMGLPALGMVLVASVVLGFLANMLGGLTIQIFPNLIPMAEQYQDQIQGILLPESKRAQFLGIVAIVVAAPICEEFLFRGTLLPEQRRSQIPAQAILLNGLLFSAMHLNPVALVSLTLVGAYFAHITLKSGSLWGAILGHAALNLVNGVILLRLAADVADPAEVGWTEVLIGLAVLAPLTALLWWASVRLIPDADDPVSDG